MNIRCMFVSMHACMFACKNGHMLMHGLVCMHVCCMCFGHCTCFVDTEEWLCVAMYTPRFWRELVYVSCAQGTWFNVSWICAAVNVFL